MIPMNTEGLGKIRSVHPQVVLISMPEGCYHLNDHVSRNLS